MEKQVDIKEIEYLKSLIEYHLDQYESAKIRLDELQPKQVESECEAVESQEKIFNELIDMLMKSNSDNPKQDVKLLMSRFTIKRNI